MRREKPDSIPKKTQGWQKIERKDWTHNEKKANKKYLEVKQKELHKVKVEELKCLMHEQILKQKDSGEPSGTREQMSLHLKGKAQTDL